MNNYETQFQTKALEATIAIHNQIKSSEEFAGYESNIDAFNTLYKEVYIIVHHELFEDADIESVIDTFFWYQSEIADGERQVDWYL